VSLSSHINDRNSPVRAFFEAHFPRTPLRPLRELTCDPCSIPLEHHAPLVWDPGPAQVLPADPTGYPWATVGTAFDYRLRFIFGVNPQRTVAANGAKIVAKRLECSKRFPVAFEELVGVSADLERGPVRGQYEDEGGLARLCYVLALYEQCFRTTPSRQSPLLALGPNATLAEVEALCTSQAADDLVRLTELFLSTQQSLLDLEPVVLNPTFKGSIWLEGADADLILGSTLLDIKTWKNAVPERPDIWQLVGYLLADFDDGYKIRSAGFYFSRHGSRIVWTVDDLLARLAGHDVDLAATRKEFSELLAAHWAEEEISIQVGDAGPDGRLITYVHGRGPETRGAQEP